MEIMVFEKIRNSLNQCDQRVYVCYNVSIKKKVKSPYIYIYIYTCIYNIYVYIILFFKLGNRIYSNTVKFEADLH